MSQNNQKNVVIPIDDLSNCNLFQFGCIECIKDLQKGVRAPKDLLEPLDFTVSNRGWKSHISATCKFGHFLDGSSNTSTATRNYLTSYPHHRKRVDEYIDHDINIKTTLAGYLCGIGSTELVRIAASIGVPTGPKSIEKCFHRVSKDFLSKIIIDEVDHIIAGNLIEETRLTFESLHPTLFHLWPSLKRSIFAAGSANDPPQISNLKISLAASLDMGWQKRSSGNKYDSKSAHMFLIGLRLGKPIGYMCVSVACRTCDNAKKKDREASHHFCGCNYEGSAKSMEPSAARHLIKELCEESKGRLFAGTLVGDDDSTMKNHCSYEGGLARNIPEPKWLADPSHRIKVIMKPVFALAKKPMKDSPVTMSDAKRLKLYVSAYIRTNRIKPNMTKETMLKHIWCTLDHLFDDHSLCCPTFCWKKKEERQSNQEQSKESSNSSAGVQLCQPCSTPATSTNLPYATPQVHSLRRQIGYYRDKKLHKVAYQQLRNALQPYFTLQGMSEILHSYNTQLNESLNTTVSYCAPKNRYLSSSIELATRVAMVAGTVSLGKAGLMKRIYKRCDISDENCPFIDSLEKEDKKMNKKRIREQKQNFRSQRARKKYEKFMEYRREEIDARANGTTYGELKVRQPKAQAPTCLFSAYGCSSTGGHKTSQSKLCKYHSVYNTSEGKKNKNAYILETVKRIYVEELARKGKDGHANGTNSTEIASNEFLLNSNNTDCETGDTGIGDFTTETDVTISQLPLFVAIADSSPLDSDSKKE